MKRDFWFQPIKHLPLQDPVQLKEENTLEDSVRAMQDSGLGCVLIMNASGKVVGIFTDKDVMEHFVHSSLPKNTKIKTIMTKNPITIKEEEQVARAAEVFHEEQIRHLPVVGEDGLTGLLSVRVLMDFISENLPKKLLNLPPDSTIISQEAEGG